VLEAGHEESDGGALEVAGALAPAVAGQPSFVQLWPGEWDLFVERVFVRVSANTDLHLILEPSAFGVLPPPRPTLALRGTTDVRLAVGSGALHGWTWAMPFQTEIELGHVLVPSYPRLGQTPGTSFEPPARFLHLETEANAVTLQVAFAFREAR